jgi:predicted ArsR family transcriptional regulator
VDPVRRALYDYVRHQDHPVTREEAAQASAISRNLTAFHLDKLVEARLLMARYEAPADQPRGRGRTPKVYEVAAGGLDITVPPRQYELVGRILTDAVAEAPNDAADAARRLAFDQGRAVGHQCRLRADAGGGSGGEPGDEPGGRSGADSGGGEVAVARRALAELGFEPRPDELPGPDEPARLSLRNCPFHSLAERHPELVCGLNHRFISGVLDGLGASRLTAQLAPQPGACCVVVAALPADRPGDATADGLVN